MRESQLAKQLEGAKPPAFQPVHPCKSRLVFLWHPKKNPRQIDEKKPPVFGDVAAELVHARNRAALSVSELHRQTGISRSVIQAYERGAYKPGAGELTRLCKALHVSPNRILFGTEEPFKAKTALHDVLRLSDEELRTPLLAVMLQMLTLDERNAVVTLIHSILEARHKDKLREAVVGLGLTADMLESLAPNIKRMTARAIVGAKSKNKPRR